MSEKVTCVVCHGTKEDPDSHIVIPCNECKGDGLVNESMVAFSLTCQGCNAQEEGCNDTKKRLMPEAGKISNLMTDLFGTLSASVPTARTIQIFELGERHVISYDRL